MSDEPTSPARTESGAQPDKPHVVEPGAASTEPAQALEEDAPARPELEAAPPAAQLTLETSTTSEPAPQGDPHLPSRLPRPSVAFLAALTAITLAADLGTKWWAKSRLYDSRPGGARQIEVIDGVFGFIFAKNYGAAWGFLRDESDTLRRPFFYVISAAAVLFILNIYLRVTPEQRALRWGLPLVLGGALGNLVDRIRYGYVVDFIDVHVTSNFRWPTFNVADIAICVGVGLMAIDMFSSRHTKQKKLP